MTEQLEDLFEECAASASAGRGVLESVHRRVAERTLRRRRSAIATTAVAVTAVVTAGVLLGPGLRDRRVPVASGQSTPSSSTYLTASGTAPGIACTSGTFLPHPAPLTTAEVPGDAALGLTVLPQGWAKAWATDSTTVYRDPADTDAGTGLVGRLSVYAETGTSADMHYDTMIENRPAVLSLTDPCAAQGYPGQWQVIIAFTPTIAVAVQGPISLNLTETQIRQIASSIVVHKLIPSLG